MDNSTTNAGAWQPRNSSSVFDSDAPLLGSRATEIGLLLGLGALVVLAHVSAHLPLKLPGHHGLEWMAILMFARTLSRERHAAAIVALASAGLCSLPALGLNEPFMGLGYLLTGLVVDALYAWLRVPGPFTLAALAGLAHVAKPLWKWAAVQGLGVSFGSITAGTAFAIGSHLGFGFVGGLAGALAGRALRRRWQAQQHGR